MRLTVSPVNQSHEPLRVGQFWVYRSKGCQRHDVCFRRITTCFVGASQIRGFLALNASLIFNISILLGLECLLRRQSRHQHLLYF